MSRHLFLTSLRDGAARWREAFPTAQTSDRPPPAGRLQAGDLVWVSAELAGFESIIAQLLRENPAAGVVAISLQPAEDEALRAFDAGARGYCHAWSTPALLQQVALVVANGGMWIGSELMGRVIAATRKALQPAPAFEPSELTLLTEREREVAREVVKGRTNKEIARALDITERTVKAHLGAIFDKLGTRDRLQLVLRLSAARESAPAAI